MLDKALQAERQTLQEERDQLKAHIDAQQVRLQQVEERLSLVVSLLSHVHGSAKPHADEPETKKIPAVDVAFNILTELDGETMHYKALADEVIARHGDILGDNAAQILVARLVNDDRFVRPARRGFYGLRKDHPKARNVGQRKARRSPRSRDRS